MDHLIQETIIYWTRISKDRSMANLSCLGHGSRIYTKITRQCACRIISKVDRELATGPQVQNYQNAPLGFQNFPLIRIPEI